MWRVKKNRGEERKKIITLSCAQNNTRQTIDFAVCKKKHTAMYLPCVNTRQSMDFAVCLFCRAFSPWHMAK